MKKIFFVGIASLALLTPASAIDGKQHDSFSVREQHGECSAGGRTILCTEIASLLSDLGVGKGELIAVSASGLDEAAHERAMRVAATIRAAGWRNVAVVGTWSDAR